MIDVLEDLIPVVLTRINTSFSTSDYSMWDSLVINRRRPHTYRVFTQIDNYRVCLHRFLPCTPEEAFAHPHPWPSAFMVLRGSYIHSVATALDFDSPPIIWINEKTLVAGSKFSFTDPLMFHKVQPLDETYTMMVNGPEWDRQHSSTRRTKGKDLKSMTGDQLRNHLWEFEEMLWVLNRKTGTDNGTYNGSEI